jgi:5-methylcytosine-specific restriction protein A
MTKPQYAGNWPAIRLFVLERDGYRCQIRGPHCEGTASHADHIVAVAHGGSAHPSNLRAACPTCNLGLSSSQRHRIAVASREW